MTSSSTQKPPIPEGFDPVFPRIPVDESDGSPFLDILQIGMFAADHWTFGPEGPYSTPQPGADATRGQIREALLHLLEIGLIDIDVERLNAGKFWPAAREVATEGETR